jgi:hypothetical protein
MYTNVLIPTDGSGLSRQAVQPFYMLTTGMQMIEDTRTEYKARMQEHAEKATTISFSRPRTISSGSHCACTTFCPPRIEVAGSKSKQSPSARCNRASPGAALS